MLRASMGKVGDKTTYPFIQRLSKWLHEAQDRRKESTISVLKDVYVSGEDRHENGTL